MRHLFLINPAAGRADQSKEITAQATALCGALGDPCDIRLSEKPGELRQFAREAGETGQEIRLYACGGDGTLNEVVSGAAEYENLSVTAFPCGSGNDFVKYFGKPDLFFDLNNFRDVETRLIDLMDVSGNPCIGICSVGLDARIGTSIDAFRRHPLLSGSRAYTASILVNLLKGIAKPCRVEIPGEEPIDEALSLVCVCNGSWYGGGYHPVPEADIEDGILDVLAVKKVSIFTVARVISAYQKGKYADYPHLIRRFRTDSLRITTPEVEPMNLDGELLRSRDITIQILPKKLRFFAPKGAW